MEIRDIDEGDFRDFEVTGQIAIDLNIQPGYYQGFSKKNDDGIVVILEGIPMQNSWCHRLIFLKQETDLELMKFWGLI